MVVPKLPFRRVTYTEAMEMLQKAGEQIKWGDDFTKPQEKRMMELVGEQAFFLKDWPGSQKAFYSMPYKENPEMVHAFDCIYGGIEISRVRSASISLSFSGRGSVIRGSIQKTLRAISRLSLTVRRLTQAGASGLSVSR